LLQLSRRPAEETEDGEDLEKICSCAILGKKTTYTFDFLTFNFIMSRPIYWETYWTATQHRSGDGHALPGAARRRGQLVPEGWHLRAQRSSSASLLCRQQREGRRIKGGQGVRRAVRRPPALAEIAAGSGGERAGSRASRPHVPHWPFAGRR